jgi:uncharacterized membrane protein YbhN (UPF0104 family)
MMTQQTVNRSGWIRLGLSLVILGGLFWAVDISTLITQFRRVDLLAFTLTCVCLTLAIVLFTVRWWYILRRLDLPIAYPRVTSSYFAGELINQVMPGGVAGEIYRGLHHRRQAGLAKLSASIVIDRAYGVVTLTLAAIIALSPMALSIQYPILLSALILLSIIALILMVRYINWPVDIGLDELTLRDHLIAVVISAMAMALIIAGFIIIAHGIGVRMGILPIVQICIIMMLASLIPFSFGDWGIREGVLTGLLVMSGQPAAQGMAIGILFGLTNIIASLPGLIHFLTDTPNKAV